MKRKNKNAKGNLLILIGTVTCVVVAPLLLVISQLGLYAVDKDNTQSVVEAAGLIAADDLSRVIINDPHFGYVSLSNRPPIGRATLAADGEPLPVTGINTLIGTVRQNMLLSRALENKTMIKMAENDRRYLDNTIDRLDMALEESLKDPLKSITKKEFVDIHGKTIDTVGDVKKFLKANLPPNIQLDAIKLSIGWHKNNDSTSMIPVPNPEHLAQIKPEQARAGQYRPFVDIPIDKYSFTFAGLGPSSRLVSAKGFCPADEKHINSIVKLECRVKRTDAHKNALSLSPEITYVTCAQPYTLPDAGPRGVMTLRFTSTAPPGMESWRELLKERNFKDKNIATYKSLCGDYPLDKEARMVPMPDEGGGGTSQLFAQHLYYWLRNGNLRPSMAAVIGMLDEQFNTKPGEIYTYEFAKEGKISRRIIPKDPFPEGVLSDNQISDVADTTLLNEIVNPIIVFKDNVSCLGTTYGGKHAGQPIPGKSLSWCEMSEYGGSEAIAKELGKGKHATQLIVFDQSNNATTTQTNDGYSNNAFLNFSGATLSLQPRRSYYSGGLALDIEIGGTMPPSMENDIVSMRSLNR